MLLAPCWLASAFVGAGEVRSSGNEAEPVMGGGVALGWCLRWWRGRLMASSDGVTWEETKRLGHHVEAVAGGEMG